MQESDDLKKYKITPVVFRKMNTEERIFMISEGFATPPGKPEDECLKSILLKTEDSKPGKVFNISRYLQTAAAIIFAVLGIYTIFYLFSKEQVRTDYGQHSEFLLPDGSNVILNAGSKICWSGKNFEKLRQIRLEGEAYLDIKKGDDFIIETKNGKVEVLGTELNVFSRNGDFRVSCITGSVRVLSNLEEKIINSGEIAELTQNGLIITSAKNINIISAWKEGIFYFEDSPLVSIFDEIERQFDVKVKFKGMHERMITVAFSNKNLNEALDIVCIPMELNYEINNKKVNIFEKQK